MEKINEEKIIKFEEEMKNNENKNIGPKICPKCGSEEVGVEAETLTPNDYCKLCGYNSLKKGVVEIINFPTKGLNKK